MEKVWKFVCLCLVVSFLKLCNGLPIRLESAIPEDVSAQFLSEVIVILLTVCTVLLLVGCLCCHRPSGFKEFQNSPVAISTISNVDNGLVNPSAEGAFTIFAPLEHGNFSSSNERFRLEEEYSYGDINVSSWFNEGVYDFPRARLKYIKELGKGWFGSVVEGTAQDPENLTWTSVVVRILDSTASTKEKVFFLHEAEIYKCGNHTNILKLHGRCLDSEPFLLLQELCPQGDLKGYLLSNRTNNNLLASEYPLVWCCQITSALKFLHEKGLAHSDLACRNCQLTSNLTVKLGDYGLASAKYREDYYEGIPTISVRWCAPESIKHTSTTIQPERITREANVWSLAVCFWEICECGARPYSELTDDEVVTLVLGKAHIRLPRPSQIVLYTDYIYRLMQSCWLTPESRPTSTQIYLTLTDLLQVFTVCRSENNGSVSDLHESQESFDMRWNSLKPNITTTEVSTETNHVKPMSPSMNNLIGSLDDMNRSRTSEEDNANAVLLPGKSQHKFEFELSNQVKETIETDSLDDSMVYNMRRSSSSETEEENWKRKIERGAYTEKVRQKSRSVTDLMILTHIDCSESESETPQPSLDHRVNYKNVRLAPKLKLENVNYVHGSEGNLLSVQDDFQAELRKLQEEHRDSLFFVPDKYSQTLRDEQVNNNVGIDRNIRLGDSNERFIAELSSASEITPVNQVYNVFNVTIDNLSPIHVVKLNEIINLEESLEFGENKTFVSYEVPKLCDIIENNSMVANFLENDTCDDYNQTSSNDMQSSSIVGYEGTSTVSSGIKFSQVNPEFNSDSVQNLKENLVVEEIQEHNSHEKTSSDNREQVDVEYPYPNSEINTNEEGTNSSQSLHGEIETNYSEETKMIKHLTNLQEYKNESFDYNNSFESMKNNEKNNIKTEESHSNDEKYHEIKIDEKHDVLFVDNQPFCDETVLNKEIILDFLDAERKTITEKEMETAVSIDENDECMNVRDTLEKEHKVEHSSSISDESQNINTTPKLQICVVEKIDEKSIVKSEDLQPRSVQICTEITIRPNEKVEETAPLVMNHDEKQNTKMDEEDSLEICTGDDNNKLIDEEHKANEDNFDLKPHILNHPKDDGDAESNDTISQKEIDEKNPVKITEILSVKNNNNENVSSGFETCENVGSIETINNVSNTDRSPTAEGYEDIKEKNDLEKVHCVLNQNDFAGEPFKTENPDPLKTENRGNEINSKDDSNQEKRKEEIAKYCIDDPATSREDSLEVSRNDNETFVGFDESQTGTKDMDELINEERNGDKENMDLEPPKPDSYCVERIVSGSILEEALDSKDTVLEKEINEENLVHNCELSSVENTNNENFPSDFGTGENFDSIEMICNLSSTDHSPTAEGNRDVKENNELENDSQCVVNENDEPFKTENPQLLKICNGEDRINSKDRSDKEKRKEDITKSCQDAPASPIEAKSSQVPKLIDLIENNDKLMDFIITNYESKLNDDLSFEYNSKSYTVEENNIVGEESEKDERDHPVISFDLSDSQEASNPNSLTHLNVFSSLRTKQKSIDMLSSTPVKKSRDTDGENEDENTNLNYSLETWDNFLGNALDTQTKNINDQTVVFESLNSEPQSMIFIEGDGAYSTVTPPNSDTEVGLEGEFLEDVYNNPTIIIERVADENNLSNSTQDSDTLNNTYDVEEHNKTYDVDELNKTYDVSTLEGSFSMEESATDDQDESGTWESNGGWFLHPQSSGNVSGQITEQKDVKNSDRFGMDDEILAALRGELLAKLPHAQGSTSEKLNENDEEWDPSEKDEVFLRYNVYNTPLSPIPEESENEEESDYICTATESPASGASDDWPEKLLENVAPQENDSQSLKTQGLHHQHTLSQDSCCSNDTLFNLEDMTYVIADQEEKTDTEGTKNEEEKMKKLEEEQIKKEAINYFKLGTAVGMPLESPVTDLESPLEPVIDKAYLADFLVKEREHSETVSVVITEPTGENPSESNSSQSVQLNKTAAPLPSPDDHPWKQLSDSLLKKGLLDANHLYKTIDAEKGEDEEVEAPLYTNVDAKESEEHLSKSPLYMNVKSEDNLPSYVNLVNNIEGGDTAVYENVEGVSDTLNEADYVNITNLENAKINAGFERVDHLNEAENPEYVEVDDCLIIRNGEEQDDQIFGVLTDIRFSGPGEPHLMSTSFSESNEIQNEQDWESGSDTRSSSSGEFIWREGEHEESLKALQALPQDLLDDIEPNQGSKGDTSSDSSCSDEDGECPEFIPSAWDKYATPTKSALRSPEKTLEKEEKKKGVWFKKQRYHCVYEYPREPDSPVLQSFDLWNNPPPATSYPEWYFDIDSNNEFNDFTTATNFSGGEHLSTDFNTTFNNEFFVTGSATPFDMMSSTSSQFFPGSDHWSESSKLNENTTPDSGVEDVTPGSMDRVDFASVGPYSNVPSLKLLAETAYTRLKQKNKENTTSELLGGLRHTRDKLKLDLPSSPNTFTSNKTFNLEPNIEPVVLRERPAFTTFGKSRFLVQHVDTPDKEITGRNVCFEALPYKPLEKKEPETKTKKIKKEEEKGEASLLDSADEDSGIESSTLERKSSDVGKLIVDL